MTQALYAHMNNKKRNKKKFQNNLYNKRKIIERLKCMFFGGILKEEEN
jgi:hypothetical protein